MNSSDLELVGSELPASPLLAVYITVLAVLSVGGVAGNLFVLVVVASNCTLHTLGFLFSVTLAVSDLCVCLTLLPLVSATSTTTSTTGCNISGGVYVYFRWGSLLAVVLISIDRCVSIRAPLRYPKLVTTRRAVVAIVILAFGVALLALLPAFGVGQYEYAPGRGLCAPAFRLSIAHSLILLVATDCVPFVLMSVAYGAMAEVALRTAKRGKIVCDENNCSYVPDRKAEIKPIQTLCTITGVYAICWVPYIGVNLWSMAWRQRPARHTDSITECLVVCNSVINPWMYSLLNTTFRSTIVNNLARIRARMSRSSEVANTRLTSAKQKLNENSPTEGGTVKTSSVVDKQRAPPEIIQAIQVNEMTRDKPTTDLVEEFREESRDLAVINA